MQLPENLIQRISSGLAVAGVVGLAGYAALTSTSPAPSPKTQVEPEVIRCYAPPTPESPEQAPDPGVMGGEPQQAPGPKPLAGEPKPNVEPTPKQAKPAPEQPEPRGWDNCPACGMG